MRLSDGLECIGLVFILNGSSTRVRLGYGNGSERTIPIFSPHGLRQLHL